MTEEREMGPGERSLRATSTAYRQAAGLPARESDEPITNSGEVSELAEVRGPDGGYGGEGDSAFTGAMSHDERKRLERREATEEATADQSEGVDLTGGETATQEALVTGEDVVDVKPGAEAADGDETVEDTTEPADEGAARDGE